MTIWYNGVSGFEGGNMKKATYVLACDECGKEAWFEEDSWSRPLRLEGWGELYEHWGKPLSERDSVVSHDFCSDECMKKWFTKQA